jgi:hypothetical protein
VGGDQVALLDPLLQRLGYGELESWSDEDGDRRGLQAVFG